MTGPHRLLSQQANILKTIQDSQEESCKKSHAQWSFLVQCPANRILLVISLRPSKSTSHCSALVKHSNTGRASTGHSTVCRPNSTNPTELSPKSKQVFGNPLRHRVVPNFSPSRDDPFKIGLNHIVRIGKLAKAISHDLSVLGIQALGLLSSLYVQHLRLTVNLLKIQVHPGHLPLTSTVFVHWWHCRCNSISERYMGTSHTVRHLLSGVLKAICFLVTLRVPASGYFFF